MNGLKDWVRLPHNWVLAGKLKELLWKDHGSTATAALMVLAPLAHVTALASEHEGRDVPLPFGQLTDLTGISKPKLAPAFDLLEQCLQIVRIERRAAGKSNRYRLHDNQPSASGVVNFAKFPGRSMYSPNRKVIEPFRGFTLRSRNELDALKLLYLFVALRDEEANAARVNFEKISEYTGVPIDRVKSATSLLVNTHLIQIDQEISQKSEYRHNLYRIVGVKPRFHSGTIARLGAAEPGSLGDADLA